ARELSLERPGCQHLIHSDRTLPLWRFRVGSCGGDSRADCSDYGHSAAVRVPRGHTDFGALCRCVSKPARRSNISAWFWLPNNKDLDMRTSRNQSLDVLRGVAILMVIGRHVPYYSFWGKIG